MDKARRLKYLKSISEKAEGRKGLDHHKSTKENDHDGAAVGSHPMSNPSPRNQVFSLVAV